jgi:SAM-dependent methyltransferase
MNDGLPDWIREFRELPQDTPDEMQRALDIKVKSRVSVLPWRGQFSPQLIEFILSEQPGKSILDPFCGSGTVLYESATLGRSATGIDVNPAAVSLASFALYCEMSLQERLKFVDAAATKILKELAKLHDKTLTTNFCEKLPKDPFYRCFLLTLFGDKTTASLAAATNSLEQLRSKLLSLPYARERLHAAQGDARNTRFTTHQFDLVVTSPPYINVFNYHQNYRPVMEALGEEPLHVAKTEIGANRKHRQNRFLTVIQYCIDMQAVFNELGRLLKPSGEAVFVVGRSSKVRGISFFNAELIAATAVMGANFELRSKRERVFTNRFGERIYEDIMVLSRPPGSKSEDQPSDEIGRTIGASALFEAIGTCKDKTVEDEIRDAYERRAGVARSPSISGGSIHHLTNAAQRQANSSSR